MRYFLKFHSGLILILLFLLFLSCEEKVTGDFNANQPPETSIFVQSSDSLNPTQSVQKIFWDGKDPDGFVAGFYYSFGENPQIEDWIWTTERNKTFRLQISGADTVYLFQVKAVDNQGVEDPTPAIQIFPIINSPPTISWAVGSTIPDTTFTVATFLWNSSDPDGDSTIAFFEYALDDTSEWRQVSGEKRSLTLTADDGVLEGEHSFFLRAVDIAGAKSSLIRMPETPTRFWYAKTPLGRYLLIDDYEVESGASAFPDAYYQSMLNTILSQSGDDFSYWNIEDQFPRAIQQFSETLKLFERVIWYTDLITQSDPHFIAAQVSIPLFRETGGKIVYTVQFNSGFGVQGDPLIFSPVDSLGTLYNIILSNTDYYPDATFQNAFPNLPALPELKVSNIIVGLIALIPKVTSVPMYRYDDPNSEQDPIFVMVGRNDNTGEHDFVFSGTPLHILNGNGNLNDIFDIVLDDLFGL
jgi:hypothetical protein